MAEALVTHNEAEVKGHTNQQRAYKSETITFLSASSDTTSEAIDMRGWALGSFKWDAAFVTAVTATLHVCQEKEGTYIAHPDFTAMDLTAAGITAASKADLIAEWPWGKVVLNAAEGSSSKTIQLVLT